MEMYDDKCFVRDGDDLGWLFNLPRGFLEVDSHFRIVLDGSAYDAIEEHTTLEKIIEIIHSNSLLMGEIEEYIDGVVAYYNDSKDLIEKHKKLFSKYGIIGVEWEFLTFEGKKARYRISFKSFKDELLFGYYFRINQKRCEYEEILSLLERLAKDKEEIENYNKWREIADILIERGVSLEWSKYFRISKNRLTLKGKGWRHCFRGFEAKLVELCHSRNKQYGWIEYDSIEELKTLFDLLGD